jgi:ribosome-binding protein aMBF1 (putative translation factor)
MLVAFGLLIRPFGARSLAIANRLRYSLWPQSRHYSPLAGVQPNHLKAVFGEVVRRRRKAAGLTQEQLSHLSGLATPFLSEIENGHKAASLVSLHYLAAGLGVKATVLVSEWERKCAKPRKK